MLAGINKENESIFDELVEDMVTMLAKLKLDNQTLLISVMQAVGGCLLVTGYRLVWVHSVIGYFRL